MGYRVTQPITHLGQPYAPGQAIVLHAFEAVQLLAAKVVEEVDDAAPAKPAEAKPAIRYRGG